jgi:hypothetical protein
MVTTRAKTRAGKKAKSVRAPVKKPSVPIKDEIYYGFINTLTARIEEETERKQQEAQAEAKDKAHRRKLQQHLSCRNRYYREKNKEGYKEKAAAHNERNKEQNCLKRKMLSNERFARKELYREAKKGKDSKNPDSKNPFVKNFRVTNRGKELPIHDSPAFWESLEELRLRQPVSTQDLQGMVAKHLKIIRGELTQPDALLAHDVQKAEKYKTPAGREWISQQHELINAFARMIELLEERGLSAGRTHWLQYCRDQFHIFVLAILSAHARYNVAA